MELKKPETLITFLAVFWITWEIFFSIGLDFLEIIFLILNIEYNDFWVLIIRLVLIGGFLVSFLWLRSRSKREKQFAIRRIP
jgi:hypothetical protein